MPSKRYKTLTQWHSNTSKNTRILNETDVETSNLAFTYSCWKWNSKVLWRSQLICSNTNWRQLLHQSKYLCVIFTVLVTHHVKNHVMQAAQDVAAVNRNENIILQQMTDCRIKDNPKRSSYCTWHFRLTL